MGEKLINLLVLPMDYYLVACYLAMVNLFILLFICGQFCYLSSPFTPLWFVLSEGDVLRIPATSYLVPLFTHIYKVLFYLLLSSHLDVPCYLTNRQRYCSILTWKGQGSLQEWSKLSWQKCWMGWMVHALWATTHFMWALIFERCPD